MFKHRVSLFHKSYRERWYQERGLPYEPPSFRSCSPFQCVGGVRVDVKPFEKPADVETEDGYDGEW